MTLARRTCNCCGSRAVVIGGKYGSCFNEGCALYGIERTIEEFPLAHRVMITNPLRPTTKQVIGG